MPSKRRSPAATPTSTAQTGAPDVPSPEVYSEQLQKVELRSVLLESLTTRVNRKSMPAAAKGIPYTFGLNHEALSYLADDHVQPVSCVFTLTSKTGRSVFVEIKARYRIEFGCPEPFKAGFFQIFSSSSIPHIVWPYARELAASVVARMGLPPLTLPALITVPAPGQSPTRGKTRKPGDSGRPASKRKLPRKE